MVGYKKREMVKVPLEEVAGKLQAAGLTILERQDADGWCAFTCR